MTTTAINDTSPNAIFKIYLINSNADESESVVNWSRLNTRSILFKTESLASTSSSCMIVCSVVVGVLVVVSP